MKLAWLFLLAAVAAWAEPPPVVRDARAPAVRELVDLATLDVGFRFDLRYATPDWKKHPPLDVPLDQLH